MQWSVSTRMSGLMFVCVQIYHASSTVCALRTGAAAGMEIRRLAPHPSCIVRMVLTLCCDDAVYICVQRDDGKPERAVLAVCICVAVVCVLVFSDGRVANTVFVLSAV